MKKKELKRAVLLGMAMSMAVWTMGMAAEEPAITTDYDKSFSETVTVKNDNDSEASIKLEDDSSSVKIKTTGEESDIILDSEGSGIRTLEGDAEEQVYLDAAHDNQINFGSGNGIYSEDGRHITLEAANDNIIETTTPTTKDNGGDGVNVTGGGKITLTAGHSNTIRVTSDGIYTSKDSTKDHEYIAKTGNNEITAGNNGIDHRGSGAITLKAENGANIITTTGGDGVRVDGTGKVILTAQENTITAGDNGIQVGNGGTVQVIGKKNSITGTFAGIENIHGKVTVDDEINEEFPNEDSLITISAESDDQAYGIYLHGVETGNSAQPVEVGDADVEITAGKINISAKGKNSSSDPTVSAIYSDKNQGNLHIRAGNGGLTVGVTASALNDVSGSVSGIYNENSGENILESTGDVLIHVEFTDKGNANGIYTSVSPEEINDSIVTVSGKNIKIESSTGEGSAFGIQTTYNDRANAGHKSCVTLTAEQDITITSNNNDGDLSNSGNSNGINVGGGFVKTNAGGSTYISAQKNEENENVAAQGIYVGSYSSAPYESSVAVTSKLYNRITAGNAIYALGEKSSAIVISEQADNQLTTTGAGVVAYQGAHVSLNAQQGKNLIKAEGTGLIASDYYGFGEKSKITLAAVANKIISAAYGIRTASSSNVILTANTEDNYIETEKVIIDEETNEEAAYGIRADTNSNVKLVATAGNNIILAGEVIGNRFGNGNAIYATGGSLITLEADNGKNVNCGAIDTRNDGTNVTLDGQVNAVYSAATISNAGGLQDDKDPNEETSFVGKSVISALYAEGNANITATGDWNVFHTTADPKDEDTLERVLWAYDGADITVNGGVDIRTDSYSISPNSADIAIAAGTAVNLTEDMVNTPVAEEDMSKVSVTYDKDSYINGDILSAYAGDVNVSAKEGSSAGMTVEGNILSGNNGSLTLDLGNGGMLTGRVDDYGDATEGHTTYFNPAFSSAIYAGGDVTLNIGSGSIWNVTGQSWVTNLSGEGGIINMTGEGDYESHALHIRNLSGEHTFVMDVDHAAHADSDMLYVDQTAEDSVQTVQFVNMDKLAGMASGEKLRFATVNADNLSFVSGDTGTARTYARDIGIKDLGLDIKSEDYKTDDAENIGYNGEKFDENKSGDATISADYENGTNWYLVRNSGEDQTSDAGKTVIAMSKVNYSNAVYMDRLNKRMGEARFLEGDDGLWVRLRHDRIGKSDAFRSKNTMFEIGYDWKDEAQKDGTHYRGFAFDYMRGTADYTNVLGEGDVRRAGLWYHDTWMGDKGHYTDYVVKYGRLSNDFDIYSELGEKIKGDYDNDVWSVSAEYGRKKDLGNDWYIEPQAQLQYAYVTDASYTTSQGTKVSLDSIDSLIGRAGFRLGRDTDEANTVYFKADILHEFLGDQSIRAMDSTGTLSATYENEGTWYDVGFGFSHRMSKDKYMFLDVEKLFGNDNEDTYQVNIGLNMAF